MATLKNITSEIADTKICPICKREFLLFTEDGKHNFCPYSSGINQIVDICIKCKVNLLLI